MKTDVARAGPPTRRYRQRARAAAAAETHERILDAFAGFLREHWFEDVTLERVAVEAGVTVQTVIRRFGSKDGLLDAAAERLDGEITARRRVAASAPVEEAVAALVRHYEVDGDLVMHLLAQEARQPALARLLARGREHHRGWVEATFARWLEPLERAARRARVDALVAATDLYVWQLLRRDLGRSRRAVTETMVHLVRGALGAPAPAPEKTR